MRLDHAASGRRPARPGDDGDGHVDFAAVTRLVVESGYAGDVEVEIFNQEIWDADPAETAERGTKAFAAHVAPWLPPVPPR